MKFLLLGGGGYLGSVLSELISERRQEVIVYDTFKYWNVQDSRKNVTDIKKLPELLLGTGGVKDSRQNVTYIKDDLTNITNHLGRLLRCSQDLPA